MTLKETLKKIKRLEIKARKPVSTMLSGQYRSAFKGRGLNFSEVRIYSPEDDYRRIDWKVTARTGVPHLKLFEEERELEVMIALDVSSSLEFGSGCQSKKEQAQELLISLAFSAIRNQDKVGLVLFSDQIESYISPQKGKSQGLKIIRSLVLKEKKEVKTSIKTVAECLLKRLKKRTIIFLISDFLDEGYEDVLERVVKRHEVIPIWVEDLKENQVGLLGTLSIQDLETGEVITVNAKKLKEEEKKIKLQKERSQKQLKKMNGPFIKINTKESYLKPVHAFFQRKHG